MPKVLDIVEVKKVIEDKFKQLYPTSPLTKDIEIERANQYPTLGIWSVFIKISGNGKTRRFSVNIQVETGNVTSFSEFV